MSHKEKLVFHGDLAGVEKARLFYKAIAERLKLPEDLTYHIELALVEVWTNIVRHAYGGQGGDIRLSAWTETNRLFFEVRDDGPPFDPREFKPPDMERYQKADDPGGFGCFLISCLMDGVDYLREDGENILTLWKMIPSP